MPDLPPQLQHQAPQQSSAPRPVPEFAIHPDLAKHTISSDELRRSIYGWFAGWREELVEEEGQLVFGKATKKVTRKIVVPVKRIKSTVPKLGQDGKPILKNGVPETEEVEKIIVDDDRRLGNEDGADYIYEVIVGLIDPQTQASKYDTGDTYNMFRGKIRNELPFTLKNKILYEGNPFAMKLTSIPEVIATLAEYYLRARKGEKGWFYERTSLQPQLAPQVSMTSDGTTMTMGVEQKKGFFDGIWNKRG